MGPMGVGGEKPCPLSSGGGVAPLDTVFDVEPEKLSPLGVAVSGGLGPIGPPNRYVGGVVILE